MTGLPALDSSQRALLDLAINGMFRGELDEALRGLVEQGFAINKGTITMPTPTGTKAAGELVRLPAGSPLARAVDEAFDRFLPINRQLREVCSAWQTHADGTPNDHTDAHYDDEVRERLAELHRRVGPVIVDLAALEPRLGRYAEQLTQAREKFLEGDSCWLASPLMDSYHTVWMHLHQELILMLGLTRAEDEAREERCVGHAAH